ncbi:MAG: RluA family pseudouridine synthase [Candidatus Bruticola sp.]
MANVTILYEDEAVLVAFKPAGVPMHANLDGNRDNFVGRLQEMLRQRDGQTGYLGIHQRLDLGTSGLVIFTRCSEANVPLAAQFAVHSLEKKYLALVQAGGHLAAREWKCCYALGEPRRRGGSVSWRRNPHTVENGFKEACTYFKLLKRRSGLLLLEARLQSGRKHQIRAHLAAQKLPLLGDTLYGGCASIELKGHTLTISRPMLHAYKLTFRHPLTERLMTISAPLPKDFADLMYRAGMGEIQDYET